MIEQGVSIESFDYFSQIAILNSQTIPVIIDKDVTVIDEGTGDSRFYSHLITVKKENISFEKYDTLTLNGDSFELQDIIQDDGFIVVINAL